MDGLLDRTFGERPRASRLVNVPKSDLPGECGRPKGRAFAAQVKWQLLTLRTGAVSQGILCVVRYQARNAHQINGSSKEKFVAWDRPRATAILPFLGIAVKQS